MHTFSRRQLLKTAIAFAATVAIPDFASASLPIASRSLHFYNTHTGESLNTLYWEKGTYIPEALKNIDYVLRDHRTNETKTIAPHLLDVLATLHRKLDSRAPFEVISGYRSPHSNGMLHAHSSGVAAKSLHMEGKAIDIRLTDRHLPDLRDIAWDMQQGGVGYYPASEFVHVDIGRIRQCDSSSGYDTVKAYYPHGNTDNICIHR